MPHPRNGIRRRRPRRRLTLAAVNAKVMKLRKDVELKFLDTGRNDSIVLNAGTMQGSLNIVAQNLTESGRVGRDIRVKSIHMKLSLILPGTDDDAFGPNSEIFRIILHNDKQTNGVQGAVGSLLESTSYDSFYNLNNTDRYQIFWDRTFVVEPTTASTDGTNTNNSGQMVKFVKVNIRNLDIPIDFTSSSGAISANTSNCLNLLYISRNGIGAIENQVRILYTDS